MAWLPGSQQRLRRGAALAFVGSDGPGRCTRALRRAGAAVLRHRLRHRLATWPWRTGTSTRFGPLELLGTAWDQPASGDLTLYWRAAEPAREDLRTALRLLDSEGNLLWEWKRSPGAGRFSTDRWPVGRMVADTYRPPPAALAQAASVQVGRAPLP